MLRMLAAQLESALPKEVSEAMPDYIRESAENFIAALKRFADEQEGKPNVSNGKSAVRK
jgi:cation transport regulator ChaB